MQKWICVVLLLLSLSLANYVPEFENFTDRTATRELEHKHEMFHLVNESLILFAVAYEKKLQALADRFDTLLHNQNELGSGFHQLAAYVGQLEQQVKQFKKRLG